jgi:hypothetical protein
LVDIQSVLQCEVEFSPKFRGDNFMLKLIILPALDIEGIMSIEVVKDRDF